MSFQDFTFSWFDPIVFIVLVVGLVHGRKRGMSGELVDLLAALLLVTIPALYYEPLAKLINKHLHLTLFWSNLLAYGAIAAVILGAFGFLKGKMGDKLVSKDMFGRFEYYLGMLAGLVRYACYLTVLISIVHARYVSPGVVEAERKKQEEAIGATVFSYGKIQMDVLYKSIVGSFVRENLGDSEVRLLIMPAVYTGKATEASGEKAWKGKTLDDVVKEK